MSGQTAGPGVGSETDPVRSPHQSFVAATGVVVFGVVPSLVVLSTPKPLSVMLLSVMLEDPAPTSHPGGQPEVLVVVGVIAERVRVVIRCRRVNALDRRAGAVDQVGRDGVAGHRHRGAVGHPHPVLAEQRPGGQRQWWRDGVAAAGGLAVAVDDGGPPGRGVVVVLAQVAPDDLVAGQHALITRTGDQYSERVVMVDPGVIEGEDLLRG